MGSSSFLNAFRLIFKRPLLILLLLPLHLALLVMSTQSPNTFPATYEMAGGANALMGNTGFYLLELLLYLLAGFLLIPPAMELLHAGAGGEDVPAGWYGRGMSKHGWKPVAIGAIETGVMFVLAIIFIVFFVILLMGVLPPTDSYFDLYYFYSAIQPVIIPLLIGIFVFMIIIVFIQSFFAMLLPAAADRSFGDAFKVLFTGVGFKKVMKVFGVYLLIEFITVLIAAAILFGYLIMTGNITSSMLMQRAMNRFMSSWVYYALQAVLSLTIVFKYGYIFSVFQEIKNSETGAMQITTM